MVSEPHGSTPYVAPEAYATKEVDARGVDIWACGIIYMVMRTGRFLWDVADRKNEYYSRYLEDRRKEEGYEPIEALHRVSFCLKSVLTPNHAIRLSHWLMHHSGSVPKRSLLHLGPYGFTTHHCLPGVEL